MLRQTCYVILLCCATSSWAYQTEEAQSYINRFQLVAIEEMQRSGIPASITLAQGIHESAAGTGRLAIESNNHFGIKCKSNWTGAKYYHKDDDYRNGKLIKSCFRAYDDPLQSYQDHTDFLVDNARYASLFELSTTDYKGWAKGLKRCGYATDPAYAQKLIKTIEKYNLQRFDQMTSAPLATAPTTPNTVIDDMPPPPPPVLIPEDYVRNMYTSEEVQNAPMKTAELPVMRVATTEQTIIRPSKILEAPMYDISTYEAEARIKVEDSSSQLMQQRSPQQSSQIYRRK